MVYPSCTPEMKKYFEELEREVERAYTVARSAREIGCDPETYVEIPRAMDMAGRVETLVGPEGIASRIRSLSTEYNREDLAIQVAKEVVKRGHSSPESALSQAVRTALAVLTEGVLVAPIEGVLRVNIKRNNNGTLYPAIQYAGPIRSAGGTAQALSVLITDIVRREIGLSKYIPTKEEIERYKEEMPLYKQEQHLQYTPSPEEIEHIVSNCPVCIDGEGTEKVEVSGYRDLPRVETNFIRGGACLVIAEGLCLKAKKIERHVKSLNIDGWEFIEVLNPKTLDMKEATPKYLMEVIGGRPVLCYPGMPGGFRLRYGRCRNTGLAAIGIHPVVMYLLDNFIAVGTQLKIEKPGKASIVTPCDSIDGPIVLLHNGDLLQVNNMEELQTLPSTVKQIVDIGEILISYGEFLENNYNLLSSGYCIEWWLQEMENVTGSSINTNEYSKISSSEAFRISEKYSVSLHPGYTLFWHDVTIADVNMLSKYIEKNGKWTGDKNGTLTIPEENDIKEILIKLGACHRVIGQEGIFQENSYSLLRGTGLDIPNGRIVRVRELNDNYNDNMEYVSYLSGVRIRRKAGERIGARVGRPEKANTRKLKTSPHILFPIGMSGGKQRLINEVLNNNKIEIEAGVRKCMKCGSTNILTRCECGGHTLSTGIVRKHTIILSSIIENAMKTLKMDRIPKVKGVQGLTSKGKTPELIEKGILRARYNLPVFRDGTTRFDMTDAPLTHFKLKEIGLSVKKAKKLGYTNDIYGDELKTEEQLLELKPQDIIPSYNCGEFLLNVSRFVDDMLVYMYHLPSFYNAKNVDDIIGHLVIGLAPHTSAGILSRIIGFVPLSLCYAHPYYHAAKRRNCDGDEDCVILLLDALINFSKTYIEEKRGGLMDIPLVLSTLIDPTEVDKEAHNMDVGNRYPLPIYEASTMKTHPRDVYALIDTIEKRLGTEKQYGTFSFTHNTSDISAGNKKSAYKLIKNMMGKVNAQITLCTKLRPVNVDDVLTRVIESHFIPDITGNLKRFSLQKIRCSSCNTKYRRIPLLGTCTKCSGNLVLTVHEGGVKKYLSITKSIMKKYKISDYTQQRIHLLEMAIDSLFESDKLRKCKLEDFV